MKSERLTILDVSRPNLLDEINNIKTKQTFLDKIEDIKVSTEAVFDSFIGFFRNIKIGISNIIYFLPTIWNNRFWDYEYTIALLVKQLEYQRDGLKKENIIEDIDKIVSQINTTLSNINNWENYDKIFESKQQKLLKQIKDEQDPYQEDYLIGTYYTNLYKFESICWNKIFDSMKKNMRAWWS